MMAKRRRIEAEPTHLSAEKDDLDQGDVQRRRKLMSQDSALKKGQVVALDGVESGSTDQRGSGSGSEDSMYAPVDMQATGEDEALSQTVFRRGNILMLRMKNFLTFDDAVFEPGPDLNLVIGPNGSGKSSIVAAILIVLNGNLKNLSRSNRLGLFIRNGRRQASLDIHLHDSDARGGRRKIKRTFDHEQSSQWLIDGKRANASEVDALRAAYGIQLDNLCMFLPQDRVSQFAEMKPHELLVNTVSSIGGQGMVAELEDLKDRYKHLEEEGRRGQSDAAQLEELRRKNQALEHDVRQFQERKELLEKIKLMESYRPWLEYAKARDTAVHMKEALESAKSDEQTSAAVLEDARGPLKGLEDQMKASERSCSQAIVETAKSVKGVAAVVKKLEQESDGYYEAASEVRSLQERAKQRNEKLNRARKELEELKKESSTVPDMSNVNDELRALVDKRKGVTDQLREIGGMKHDLQMKITRVDAGRSQFLSQLKELESGKQRLIEKLNRTRRDNSNMPGRCYEWIRANQNRFRGTVYGPVALEIKVDDEYHARVLESCVPAWAMCALVATTAADRDILLSELKDKQKMRIDVLLAPSRPDVTFSHPTDLRDVKQFGLYTYVSETFDAPESVKRALLAQFPLHNILIGDRSSIEKVEAIGNAGVQFWYSPESSYNVKTSRYGDRNKSTMISPLRQARILANAGDDRRDRARLEEQIQAATGERDETKQSLQDLNTRSNQLSSEAGALSEQIEDKKRRRQAHQKLVDKMSAKERIIGQYEKEENDNAIEDKIKEFNRKRASHLQETLSQTKKLANWNEQHKQSLERQNRLAVDHVGLAIQAAQKSVSLKKLFDDVKRTQEERVRLETEYRDSVHVMKQKKALAERQSPRTRDTRELFERLPGDLGDLDDLIQETRSRADAMVGTNEQLVRDYERREKAIETLKERIANAERHHAGRRDALDENRVSFIQRLLESVSLMSAKFTRLFKEIQCVGELRLQNQENLHELYIEILELTPNSPFRVVDEMNQGVDSRNERALMSMMIRDATRQRSAQSFIITPKLLEDLPLNRRVVPHIILNGEVDGTQEHWNPERYSLATEN